MATENRSIRKPRSLRARKRRLAQKQAITLNFQTLEARHLLASVTVGNATDVLSPTANTTSITALLAADGGDGISLREAITAANNTAGADTIMFSPSVFVGGVSSLIRLGGSELTVTETLTIDGSTATDVTVTGDALGDDVTDGAFITNVSASFGGTEGAVDDLLDDNSRVLNFTSSTGELTLDGLTLTGGRAEETFGDGGGILFSSFGSLSLMNSTVSGNSSNASGGGISARSGYVSLISSTVLGNHAVSGGGGIWSGRDVSLTNSTVSGNSISGGFSEGGGISSLQDVSLTNSTVSGNSTTGVGADGGGIFSFTGDVSLINSTVSGNSVLDDSADGGGIGVPFGNVLLKSSTVSGNSAGRSGGGIQANGNIANRTIVIINSIVAGNTDNGGTPNDLVPDPDSVLTINHSLIGVADNIVQPITGNVGNQTGTALMPLDPLLGPLGNNGGPTQTHTLLPGSPAIDAGGTIPNSSFENAGGSLDNWQPLNNVTLSTAQAIDGTYSAQVGGDPTGFSVLSQGLAVEPGSEVVAQVQAGVDMPLPAGQLGRLKIEFYEVFGGQFMVPGEFISQVVVTSADANTPVGSWNLIENIATAPAGAVEARIVLTYAGTTTTSSIFYDDVTVLGAGDTPRYDQRGAPLSRDDGNGVDIGAFEDQETPILIVTTNDDIIDATDQLMSLREAIILANGLPDADTIAFDPAVFTGGASSLIRLTQGQLEITDTLIIDASLATDVTITGDALGDDVTDGAFITDVSASFGGTTGAADDLLDDNTRVLNFSSATGDLTLDGLTLTGGRTTEDNEVSTELEIETAFSGGGIRFLSEGILTVPNSNVSGNSVTGNQSFGGGIFTVSGDVALTSSTASGNTSGSGGGIHTSSGSVSLTSSTVSENSTHGSGADGGGIHTHSGDVLLTNSTVSGNSTSGSNASGGGISTRYGDVLLTSSTVSGNSASGFAADGGGIHIRNTLTAPSLTIENSIVAGNTRNGTASDLQPGNPNGTLSINHSLIGATALTISGTSNQVGSLGSPIDALLGPLSFNGGPTRTHALLPGSPAIDAGNNMAESEDQRGSTRVVDQPGIVNAASGNGADIGAFERRATEPIFDPPIVTSFVRDEGGALARPDLLTTISVTFSRGVNVSAGDLIVRNDTTSGAMLDTQGIVFSYDMPSQTATWDFSSLPDLDAAFYSFELSDDIVSVAGNLSLDGDEDGSPGVSYVESIYVAILGDLNLDGDVDVTEIVFRPGGFQNVGDASVLLASLPTASGASYYDGDLNGDGDVDISQIVFGPDGVQNVGDASILLANLGRNVLPPANLNSTAATAASALAASTSPLPQSADRTFGDQDQPEKVRQNFAEPLGQWESEWHQTVRQRLAVADAPLMLTGGNQNAHQATDEFFAESVESTGTDDGRDGLFAREDWDSYTVSGVNG